MLFLSELPSILLSFCSLTMSSSSSSQGLAARLARPNILTLRPYRCARDDYSTGILLDANENALGPSIPSEGFVLERYPDPYQIPLKQALVALRSRQYDLPQGQLTPQHVFVGVGSDEAIDLLMRIFCVPSQDCILTTPPTYGMYQVCAKINDVGIVPVPLTPTFQVVIPEVSSCVVQLY
jgi:histidinol-phosphate aminotransferase